ncbi:MAG: LytTR family DNA-binding domain-containing protein [Bacteroidota bacterium]
MPRKHPHPYWWCQLIGWGLVGLYWWQYPQRDLAPTTYALMLCGQVALQILATDVYRRLAHRRGWLRLPLPRLVGVMAIAWVLLVAQYLLMSFVNYHLRFPTGYFTGGTFLGAFTGGIRYHAIWLLLFHGYHLARRPAEPSPQTDPAPAAAPPRLYLPNASGGHYVDLSDIHLIRVYGHYLRIYHPGGTDLLKKPLSTLEKELPSADFFRTNRSDIIAVAAIEKIENQSRGRYRLTLQNGETTTISESRARQWRARRPKAGER